MAYLYRHIRLDTNKVFYVGIGSDDKYKRAKVKTNRSSYWKNIVNKTDYKIEIIIDDIEYEQACKKEIEFIQLYGRKDKGLGTLVNLTNGGEGTLGIILSDETRKKMSLSQSGKVLSESTLIKFRAKKSEQTKLKMCNPKTEEHKLNISKARLGVKAKLIICPNCNKKGGENTMKRWHFNNCKFLS